MNIITFLLENKESLEKSLLAVEKTNPLNCHDHIHILYSIIDFINQQYNPDLIKYLEIGTFRGGSIATCIQNDVNVEYTGIDLFDNCKSHCYSIENVRNNIDKVNKFNHNYKLISGNSHLESTYQQLDGLYNMIFIDGCHKYESVIKDFNIYKKFIDKNGFIIFDDYESWPPVKKAVKKIIKDLDKNQWIIHGNVTNLLPNKCSRINFNYHNKIGNSSKLNKHLDEGKYLINNEFIIQKKN